MTEETRKKVEKIKELSRQLAEILLAMGGAELTTKVKIENEAFTVTVKRKMK